MVYQEQVMQCAQVIGGYTLGAADILRRAMGKKNKEEMAKQRDIFIAGAGKERRGRRRKRRRSSTSWRSSRATASTSRTPPPTR
jgi:DNA polymerase III alpha subunit